MASIHEHVMMNCSVELVLNNFTLAVLYVKLNVVDSMARIFHTCRAPIVSFVRLDALSVLVSDLLQWFWNVPEEVSSVSSSYNTVAVKNL